MTMWCEFNPQECHLKCKNFPICSLIHIEEKISDLESRMSSLYEGINSITEFCSKLGENFSFFKEDTIYEFNILNNDIKSLRNSLTGSKET